MRGTVQHVLPQNSKRNRIVKIGEEKVAKVNKTTFLRYSAIYLDSKLPENITKSRAEIASPRLQARGQQPTASQPTPLTIACGRFRTSVSRGTLTPIPEQHLFLTSDDIPPHICYNDDRFKKRMKDSKTKRCVRQPYQSSKKCQHDQRTWR